MRCLDLFLKNYILFEKRITFSPMARSKSTVSPHWGTLYPLPWRRPVLPSSSSFLRRVAILLVLSSSRCWRPLSLRWVDEILCLSSFTLPASVRRVFGLLIVIRPSATRLSALVLLFCFVPCCCIWFEIFRILVNLVLVNLCSVDINWVDLSV